MVQQFLSASANVASGEYGEAGHAVYRQTVAMPEPGTGSGSASSCSNLRGAAAPWGPECDRHESREDLRRPWPIGADPDVPHRGERPRGQTACRVPSTRNFQPAHPAGVRSRKHAHPRCETADPSSCCGAPDLRAARCRSRSPASCAWREASVRTRRWWARSPCCLPSCSYVVFALDHPLSVPLGVSPEPPAHVVTVFDAVDRGA